MVRQRLLRTAPQAEVRGFDSLPSYQFLCGSASRKKHGLS